MMRPTVIGVRFSWDRRAQSSSSTSTGETRKNGLERVVRRGRDRRELVKKMRRPVRRFLRSPSGAKSSTIGKEQRLPVRRVRRRARASVFKCPTEHVLDAIEQVALVLLVLRACAARTFPPAASSRAVRATCRCSLLSFLGVRTCTVANRSPFPRPLTSGMPLPRSRSVVPVAVPSGTLTSSVPSSVGTWISPPSATVVKLTGISQNRFRPSRRKNSCSCTWTTT